MVITYIDMLKPRFKHELADRNIAIFIDWLELRLTQKALSIKYGLSPERIRQILHKVTRIIYNACKRSDLDFESFFIGNENLINFFSNPEFVLFILMNRKF